MGSTRVTQGAHFQRAQRDVRDHLLVAELVPLCALDDAVQQQHLSEGRRQEHADVLHAPKQYSSRLSLVCAFDLELGHMLCLGWRSKGATSE